MRKKVNLVMLLTLCFVFVFGGIAYAFNDVQGHPAEKSIIALSQAGIISGVDESRFAPNETLNFAQGVHLLVKGLGLNIDPLRFIKAPQASDYFVSVPNDAWYAESMIIAHLNGLPMDRNIDPNQALTREQFAYLLAKAVAVKGDFVYLKIFIQPKDMDQITPDYMNDIQPMLAARIVLLDDDKSFRPKDAITRGEAAQWLYAATKFVEQHSGQDNQDKNDGVTMSTESITQDVNKITLAWGEKPNLGYRITIDKIEFDENNKQAVIYYRLHTPEPGHMYGQMVTEPKAIAYLAGTYQAVIKPIK